MIIDANSNYRFLDSRNNIVLKYWAGSDSVWGFVTLWEFISPYPTPFAYTIEIGIDSDERLVATAYGSTAREAYRKADSIRRMHVHGSSIKNPNSR